MATGAEVFIRKLTKELDELAVKYNKTKDPGLRDLWFKKVSQVQPLALEEARLLFRKKTLGKARTFRSD